MELQDELLVLRLGVAMEHVLVADSPMLVDWHDVTVRMGSSLIEMHHEADDVLLTELTRDKVVDVLCPLFNLRIPLDVLIATFRLKIDLLIAKCQFRHAVMGTTEDELDCRADVRVLTPLVRILDATCGKHFCHTLVKRS